MQVIRKLDDWLIGQGGGTIGDRISLYGFYAATALITIATLNGLAN